MIALSLYANSWALSLSNWQLLTYGFIALAPLVVFQKYCTGSLIYVLLAGVAAFLYCTSQVPLDVQAANMLFSVEAACNDTFSGKNPYLADHTDIASAQLYYLPLLYFPYCPAVYVNLDLRIINIACYLLILGVIFYKSLKVGSLNRAALFIFPLFFSPPVLQMLYYGHIWVYWLSIVLLILSVQARNYLLAAFLLGATLSMRQTSLFFIAPLCFLFLQTLPFKQLLYYGSISFATYLILVSPSFIYVEGFIHYFYLGISKTVGDIHILQDNPINQVSISGLLSYVRSKKRANIPPSSHVKLRLYHPL